MTSTARRTLATIAWLVVLTPAARADSIHLYSYDPADAETTSAAGPLTFTVRKGLLHTTLLNLRSTVAPATAYVRPASEGTLGPGGLRQALGREPPEHALYEIETAEEGAALIDAFCPGAKRAWLAAGPIRFNRGLTILVIGAPADGDAKLCRTLNFSFHGEWALPPGRRMDPRELERGRYPGA